MHHPPKTFIPTNVTPFLVPHQKIALLLHEQVVAGNIQDHIFMQRHGLQMENRLTTHRGINRNFHHVVDWQALVKLAFKHQDTLGKINTTKILHDLWPTMTKLENRKTGVSNVCPRCKKESRNHSTCIPVRSKVLHG